MNRGKLKTRKGKHQLHNGLDLNILGWKNIPVVITTQHIKKKEATILFP